MKKFFVLIILTTIICTAQVAAKPIVLRKEGFFQHKGMRMPSSTLLYADIEEDVLTLNVSNYYGIVNVIVNNTQGANIFSANSFVEGKSTIVFNLPELSNGEYIITIELDNTVYSGRFVM
ncbi:DUF3244 domain-containing protein [Prevotella lacticifex]|jgi:hypothetical protein|uniref:DUF3244 domain-containing protein n=1 Tax=Prevotella lacticifex TaxID=2854755 RepID=A0A9R1CCV4_9BACT|nr:DUF3244 domain-containing protein [Prevotella lacticifex]MDY6266654.1 DUF3244 domain-containing protein [Prevotella sp.]GJG34989.1 hypothetical protein PRLR5003_01460 [Prevotella lacticifex]GJG39961.1 hypothetical protein PRLR5019_19320 [Prevotella lacticifex]GJG41358.1 hypothetical protein PRLR5025_01440 [Prevotella lacticifex]GJG46314.1 hypothetical protein PRLR5027_19090 [Prevotella lacticifex]